jgi:hypothetical protein
MYERRGLYHNLQPEYCYIISTERKRQKTEIMQTEGREKYGNAFTI